MTIERAEEIPEAEQRLRIALEPLHPPHRAAFAASCAERFAPLYLPYANTAKPSMYDILTDILDKVWCFAQGGQPQIDWKSLHRQMIAELGPQCAPGDADAIEDLAIDGLDVVALAVSYCGSLALSDAIRIGISARGAVEAYMNWVADDTQHLSPDPALVRIEEDLYHDWVMRSPLMIGEVHRQHFDLAALAGQDELTPGFIRTMRARSKAAGIQPVARGLFK